MSMYCLMGAAKASVCHSKAICMCV